MSSERPTGSIGWGIIGCGDVAEHKGGPALYHTEDSELVAVMSRRVERAKPFAERHGARRHYTRVEDLLADPEVDAVYVATPPDSHLELSRAAAEAGKHVLCEKPMALTVAECRQMIDACRTAGVQLMIAYYRRFWPVVERMKELVDSGAIGEVMRVRAQVADFYRPRADGERAWLTNPAVAGGGFLTDVATHRIDLMAHFLGEPRQVAAFVDTQHFEIGVDDASSLIIRFENHRHATGAFSWNVGVPIDEFEVAGTEGRLTSRNLGRGDLEWQTVDRVETSQLRAPSITHLDLVRHFVRCLRTGEPNRLPGEAGMVATRVTEAAYRSSTSGTTVDV
jgi:1,5-anhydro-D-fructose reductase (1,5-anhydro-D-mannitol-forming)